MRYAWTVVLALVLVMGVVGSAVAGPRNSLLYAAMNAGVKAPASAVITVGDYVGDQIARLRRNGKVRPIESPGPFGPIASSSDGQMLAVILFTDDWARTGGLLVWEEGRWGNQWWYSSPVIECLSIIGPDTIAAQAGQDVLTISRPTEQGEQDPVLLWHSPIWLARSTVHPNGTIAGVQVNPDNYMQQRLVLVSGETVKELPWLSSNVQLLNLSLSADGSRLIYRQWEQYFPTTDYRTDIYVLDVAETLAAEQPSYGECVKQGAFNPGWLPNMDRPNDPNGDPDSDGITYVTPLDDPLNPDALWSTLWMVPEEGSAYSKDFKTGFVTNIWTY